MARTPSTDTVTAKRKGRPISASISPELYAALEDHSFDIRERKLSNIVTKALVEYADNHGIAVPEAAQDAPEA
jgi:hypothetical protein